MIGLAVIGGEHPMPEPLNAPLIPAKLKESNAPDQITAGPHSRHVRRA